MRTAFHTSGLILGIFLLFSSTAHADQHFILELNGGVATESGIDTDVEAGKAFSGTFGFGGRIPGQSPAYYLVGRIGQSHFGYQGADSLSPVEVDHVQREWALGGRLYLPVTDQLRISGQVALGQTTDESTIRQNGLPSMNIETDSFAIFGQIGLQYRITDGFALGAAADIAVHPSTTERDKATQQASVGSFGELGRAQIGLTGTFHF